MDPVGRRSTGIVGAVWYLLKSGSVMSGAVTFGREIAARAARFEPVTHLKLQKLAFYGWGALVAHGLEAQSGYGPIRFEAWKHGPVCHALWLEFRSCRSDAIPLESPTPHPDRDVEQVLEDVVEVYGPLGAWALRCETHLEVIWKQAFDAERAIEPAEFAEHFRAKFARGRVRLPAHRGGPSAALDGLPVATFESLHELAERLRARKPRIALGG